MDVGPLLSCEWLQEKITSGNMDRAVVLDVSWSSEEDKYEKYKQRHVAGARYMNVLVGPHTELFPRNIPTPEVFQEHARAAGVNEDTHVIVYSDSDKCGFFVSGRAWWTFLDLRFKVATKEGTIIGPISGRLWRYAPLPSPLQIGHRPDFLHSGNCLVAMKSSSSETIFGAKRISILNGGLEKWLSLGYPVTSEIPDVKVGNFKAEFSGKYYCRFDEMTQLAPSGAVIVDSRPPEQFSAGHIPGAKSLPFGELVDNKKMEIKSTDDVRKVLQAVGVDFRRPFISYCNSGMSSCTLGFAYLLCGGKFFSLFHGGFNQWKRQAADRIEQS